MRPINLIPPEERRSTGAALRTGPFPYVLVGTLAILLAGIVAFILTSNQVSERESEIAALQTQKAAATAKAESLSAYTSFNQVAEQRTKTVSELADGRFDWVRVIRQLSLVLPGQVYLTGLNGSAGGGVGESGNSGITGPSLTLGGCASGQQGVAEFITALKQIDGVTRVELNDSALTQGNAKAAKAAGPCSQGGMAIFQMVVAFDGAPPSPDSTPVIPEETEAPEAEGGAGEESGSESSESSSSEEGESSEGEGRPTEPGTSETESSSTSAQASPTTTEAAG
jgi:Tfp pilus assembly protein PilN